MKNLHDWVEFRYAETKHSPYHPNLTCKAGDDAGDQYNYSKKTVIEMKRYIQLRGKYDTRAIKLVIHRVRVDRL